MATMVPGKQQRAIVLGTTVQRATATLPATAAQTIFNVAGGAVFVTSLIGQVTTAIQAQATTVQIQHTVGATTTNLTTAAGDVNAAVVGTIVALPGALGGASPVQVGAGASGDAGFVLGTGALKYVTGATSTGSIKWTITYVPIDDGASVTAA